MSAFTTASTARQRGLSLIEMLVGLVIGGVALLAVFQTVTIFDRHTETTTSGGDAQIAGSLAIFNIERDVKEAGFGFGRADPVDMGCLVNATDVNPPRAFAFAMSPVEIVPGAGGAPDQINVLYGSSAFFGSVEKFDASTPNSKHMVRRNGFKAGDVVVVASSSSASAASSTCQLVEITDASIADGFTVAHDFGVTSYPTFYGAANQPMRFNSAASGLGETFTAGTMYNLGPAPRRNTWSVVNGHSLMKSDLIRVFASEVSDGVVNLKAQYGIDLNNDGQISSAEWVAATPATQPTDWTKVLAIRVAVLVRSRQFERNGDPQASAPAPVTVTVPTWSGSASSPFLMTDVNAAADNFGGSPNTPDPNNWRFYRYRVYERSIYLRNMLWGQLGS
jgi:type IV pilus assembly protein PilW